MATNRITINFTPCNPDPANGYVVSYRPTGSDEDLRVWPDNFFSTPIVFDDENDTAGTQYEGYIQGDCGDGQLGLNVPFVTEGGESQSDSGGESGSDSGSEGDCDILIHWAFEEEGGIGGQGALIIQKNGVTVLTQSSNATGTLHVAAGDVINCRVFGQTGTNRSVSVSNDSNIGDDSDVGDAIVEFTAHCDHTYEVLGQVSVNE